MSSSRAAILCLILLAAAPCVFASNWVGTIGSWTDPANWDEVPRYYGNNVVIDNSGTAIITSDVMINNVSAGINGSGNIQQSGGTTSAQSVTLGSGTGTGTYELSGGTLYPGMLTVNRGSFALSGGALHCGPGPGSGLESINDTFVQTGGLNTISNSFNMAGTYTLSGDGGLSGLWATCASTIAGKGFMIQTGGHVSFKDRIATSGGWSYGYFQVAGSDNHGNDLPYGGYELSAGSFEAGTLYIGDWYSQTAASSFNIKTSLAQVTAGSVIVKPGGGLKAVPGSKITINNCDYRTATSGAGGNFAIWNSNASQVADLANTTLDFELAYGTFEKMIISGHDLGSHATGFEDNFAVGAITVGHDIPTTLKLSDGTGATNETWGLGIHEAQYVESLLVGAGSTLDLKGCKLYYYDLTNLGTILLNGGSLVQVFRRGDFNQDGHVDDADYTVWADYFHRTPPSGYQTGDDASGGYDDGDYTNWADHFNGFGGNSTVPEPATLGLLLAGALALRRRRAA